MGDAQGTGHLTPDLGDLPRREHAVALDLLVQRTGADELHDDPGPAVLLDHVVHGHDAGVAEPRGGPRLPEGALVLDLALLVGEAVREDHFLDRDVAAEGLVPGMPDGAHAAAAYLGEQAIALRKKGVFRHSSPTIPTARPFVGLTHTQSPVQRKNMARDLRSEMTTKVAGADRPWTRAGDRGRPDCPLLVPPRLRRPFCPGLALLRPDRVDVQRLGAALHQLLRLVPEPPVRPAADPGVGRRTPPQEGRLADQRRAVPAVLRRVGPGRASPTGVATAS